MDGVEETAVESRRDDQRKRHGCRDELLEVEPRVSEQAGEAPSRKEAHVGAVEDAAVRILPAAEEEREPDPEMRHVRDRDDHASAGSETAVQSHENRQRIGQMLEHVTVHDRVEDALEPGRSLVEVGDDHVVAAPARLGGLRGIALERGYLPSLPRQELGEEAVGGSDLEGAPTPP